MSRFIPHGDMTTDQILRCSYEIGAILRLCEAAAWAWQNGSTEANLAGATVQALQLAHELLEPVHDAIELHEGRAST
jgi:hypothetical protein